MEFKVGDTIRSTLDMSDSHYINPSFICHEIDRSTLFKRRYIVSMKEIHIGEEVKFHSYHHGKRQGIYFLGLEHCNEICVTARMLLLERRR